MAIQRRPVNDDLHTCTCACELCVTSTPRCVFGRALRSRCALRDALQLSSFTRVSLGPSRGPKGVLPKGRARRASCAVRSARALAPPTSACLPHVLVTEAAPPHAVPAWRIPLSVCQARPASSRSYVEAWRAQRMVTRQEPSRVSSMPSHGRLLIACIGSAAGRRPGGGSASVVCVASSSEHRAQGAILGVDVVDAQLFEALKQPLLGLLCRLLLPRPDGGSR